MTTSPLTNTQIEDAASDGGQLPERPSAPPSLLAEWRRFAGFLVRPTLPGCTDAASAGLRGVARLLSLDALVMVALLSAIGLATSMGLELPENVNNSLGLTVGAVLLVVIGAPIGEELVFRSWLRGTPAVMAVVAICVLGLGVWPVALTTLNPEGGMDLVAVIGPLIALIAAPLSAFLLWRRPTPRLFRAGFPVFFWLSSAGFALVHFANYTLESWGMLVIILPLLLPQMALGTMLGYLRVHYGLVHAIALHALHNGILFGLAMAGKALSEAGEAAIAGAA